MRRGEARKPRLTTGTALSPVEQLMALTWAEGLSDMTAAEGAAIMLDLAAIQQGLDDLASELGTIIGAEAIVPLMPESKAWLVVEEGRIVVEEEGFALASVKAMRAGGKRPGDAAREEIARLVADGADSVRPSILFPEIHDVEALLRALEMVDFADGVSRLGREAVCRATDEVFDRLWRKAGGAEANLVEKAVEGYLKRNLDLRGFYGEVHGRCGALFSEELAARLPFSGCRDEGAKEGATIRLAAKMLIALDEKAAKEVERLCRVKSIGRESLAEKMRRAGMA